MTPNRTNTQPATVDSFDKTTLGFWVYLMTDCVLFASLFAVYAVQHGNTNGGPAGAELFSLPFVLAETLILLTSSLTAGLALLTAQRRQTNQTVGLLAVTFILGAVFIGLEVSEFSKLVAEGNSWQRSGFLSAFFTLVATHGLHITSGLIWIAALVPQLLRRGITAGSLRRLTLFSVFWHFLDLVWIFIFTMVYLLGALHV